MQGGLQPQPSDIQRELRIVLRHGLRPAMVERCLERLPVLMRTTAPNVDPTLRFDVAIAVCDAIQTAIQEFGDGPFGLALQALFGVRAGTRGLNLDKRRGAAASVLDREPATVARHWERWALLDLAVAIYRNS